MGRRRSLREPGPADLQGPYVQEKGACAGGVGGPRDASRQANGAPVGACAAASGPRGKVEGTVAEVRGTFLSVRVEVEREKGRSQGPEVGSLTWGCVLGDHQEVRGSTGEHRAEK